MCTHNHQLSNKKGLAIHHHPDNPSQKETKTRVCLYETWKELWHQFKIDEAEIANKITNPKNPNKCPMLLLACAPWEMVKCTDSSCLCMDCEDANVLKRGSHGSMLLIDRIINRVKGDMLSDVNNNDPGYHTIVTVQTSNDLVKLDKHHCYAFKV